MKTATKQILPGDPLTVLTYDHPHRKTYDLVTMLCAHGYRPRLFALPWVERKSHTPLIPHRPPMRYSVGPGELAEAFDLEFHRYPMAELPNVAEDDEVILIGGAGIIPTEVLAACPPIINSHPGYLPYTRGLDSLKWAIMDGWPIGVTVHYVTSEVDAGPMIYKPHVSERIGDTFGTLAHRVYEEEVCALLRSLTFTGLINPTTCSDALEYPPHRRMPHSIEMHLEKRLQYRQMKAQR